MDWVHVLIGQAYSLKKRPAMVWAPVMVAKPWWLNICSLQHYLDKKLEEIENKAMNYDNM